MKKSIIAAGAASVALAAMPIVSTFAATVQGEFTDTLNLTVGEICTLTRLVESDNGGHPAGAGAPDGASWTTAGTTADVFAATIVAGQTYNDIAESKFDITCNNVTQGYKVTVATDGTLPYNAGGYDDTDGASSWYIASNGDNENLSASVPGNVAWQHNATATVFENDSFTATYNVKADISLAKGSYTAIATYTLAEVE